MDWDTAQRVADSSDAPIILWRTTYRNLGAAVAVPIRQERPTHLHRPTRRLTGGATTTTQLPLTAAEVVAIQQIVATPAQRLVIALTAVHAVRPATIRQLRLDDVDLPNRRITLAGHPATLAT